MPFKFQIAKVSQFWEPAVIVTASWNEIGTNVVNAEVWCLFPDPHPIKLFGAASGRATFDINAPLTITPEFMLKDIELNVPETINRHIAEYYSAEPEFAGRRLLVDGEEYLKVMQRRGRGRLDDVVSTKCDELLGAVQKIRTLPSVVVPLTFKSL